MHKKNCKSISKTRDALPAEGEFLGGLGGGNMPEVEVIAAGIGLGGGPTVHLNNLGPEVLGPDFADILSDVTMLPMICLADLLVGVAYRECDTIEHGSVYYREALRYYVEEPMKVLKGQYHNMLDFAGGVEDRILLLLVALGGDDKTLMSWCIDTKSPRFAYYMPVVDPNLQRFKVQAFLLNDITYHVVLLLSLMKQLAEHRRNVPLVKGLAAYKETSQDYVAASMGTSVSMEDISSNISSYLMRNAQDGLQDLYKYEEAIMDAAFAARKPFTLETYSTTVALYLMGDTPNGNEFLSERIRLVISAIKYHGNGGFLASLASDITMTKEMFPQAFCGTNPAIRERGLQNGMLDGFAFSSVDAPCHQVLQDCFRQSPGVRDILSEFLSPQTNAKDEAGEA